jgi:hypothetical protein
MHTIAFPPLDHRPSLYATLLFLLQFFAAEYPFPVQIVARFFTAKAIVSSIAGSWCRCVECTRLL